MDSDYVRCTGIRCSTPGYIFTLRQGAISWSSKCQPIVTTSSCEAEYIASCHAVKEAMWLCKLMDILGHMQPTTIIHSNNMGSITLTKDPSFHRQSKHIDVQFHCTHEHVDAKDIFFQIPPHLKYACRYYNQSTPTSKT